MTTNEPTYTHPAYEGLTPDDLLTSAETEPSNAEIILEELTGQFATLRFVGEDAFAKDPDAAIGILPDPEQNIDGIKVAEELPLEDGSKSRVYHVTILSTGEVVTFSGNGATEKVPAEDGTVLDLPARDALLASILTSIRSESNFSVMPNAKTLRGIGKGALTRLSRR